MRAGFFHVNNVEDYFNYRYAFGRDARVKKWIQADGAWHELRAYHAARNSLRRWIDARAITSRGGLDIRPGDVVLIDSREGARPDHIVMVHSWDPRTSTLFTIGGNDTGYEVDTRRVHTAPLRESAADLARRTRLEAATGQPLRPGESGARVGVGTQDLSRQPDPAVAEAHPERARPRVRVFGIGRPSIVDFEEHAYDSLNNTRPDLRRRP